jgi:hypothetical protein
MGDFLIAKMSALFGVNEFLLRDDLIGFLGWFNIVLAVIAVALFTLRRVNKYAYNNKNNTLKKILKPLSKIHPVIGITLLISAFLHGDLALGSIFRIHTGPLAWWILLLMFLTVMLGKQFKVIPQWIKIHRVLAVLMVASIALHLLVRNLFG